MEELVVLLDHYLEIFVHTGESLVIRHFHDISQILFDMQLVLQVAFFSLDDRTHMGVLLRFFIFLQLFDVVKVAGDESTIQRLFASAIISLYGLIASISHDLCFYWLLGRIRL